MEKFKTKLLDNKAVSVWGVGYLGYTTILRLQSRGFSVNAFDFNTKRIDEIQDGEYPRESQRVTWTTRGDIPNIELSRVNFTKSEDELFNSNVHIIAMPFDLDDNKNILKLFNALLENRDRLEDSLVIFQSLGVPGDINSYLKDINSDILAAAFRDDWCIEDFFKEDFVRVIASDSKIAQEKIEFFFKLFDIKTEYISSIKEAEILSNAKRSIATTVNGFLNQLVFAYPDTNLKDLSKIILKNLSEEDIKISIGSSRFKEASANNSLIQGSKKQDALSLLKDANSSNLSLLLHYGDLLVKKGYKRVAIFGISGEGDIKEVRVAPSIILAEYLSRQEVAVCINDPFFKEEEISEILPFATTISLEEKVDVDAVIFMTNHREYKYLTMRDLKSLGIIDCKLIIDNTEIFSDFDFPKSLIYHIAGDGKLEELES